MRVGHCLLLSSALWLLAEELTEAHDVRPITEDDEAQKCPEFREWMDKWKKNRVALKEHVIILSERNSQLSDLKKYIRDKAQTSVIAVGGLSAVAAFAGRGFRPVILCLWAGVFCMCAVDYAVKSYYEHDINELVFKVHTMAKEDMRLQREMLDQLCDEPPFVGMDETAKILMSSLEQTGPPSWLDHNIGVDQPRNKELTKGSQWLYSISQQLEKKLESPIDPPKTAAHSPEQVAAMHSRNQGEPS